MNVLYRIIIFTFLVNVCTGIITSDLITGWDVDFSDKINDFNTLNNSAGSIALNPVENPTVDPSGFSLFDNIFGIQIFGWLNTITQFLKDYLYGMVGILLSVLSFPNEARLFIQSSLYIALTLMYGFGIAGFITGKVFND